MARCFMHCIQIDAMNEAVQPRTVLFFPFFFFSPFFFAGSFSGNPVNQARPRHRRPAPPWHRPTQPSASSFFPPFRSRRRIVRLRDPDPVTSQLAATFGQHLPFSFVSSCRAILGGRSLAPARKNGSIASCFCRKEGMLKGLCDHASSTIPLLSSPFPSFPSRNMKCRAMRCTVPVIEGDQGVVSFSSFP